MARIDLDLAALNRAIRTAPGTAGALRAKGEEVADLVCQQGIRVGDQDGGPDEIDLPVEVHVESGATPSMSVVLAHAAGLAVQAKHGSLTRAAAQAGLKLTGGGE